MADETTNEQADPFGRTLELKAALTQGDAAAWNRAYVQLGPVGLAEGWGAALKAAIAAGWIVAPETRLEEVVDLRTGRKSPPRYWFDGIEVDELPAAQARFYGRACERRFNEETRVPDPKN